MLACMHARIVNSSQLQLTTKSQSIIDISACLQECMHVIRNPISCTIDYHWTIPIPCGAITRDEAKNKDPRPFDTLTDWQRVWQSTQRGGALPFLRMCQLRRRKQAYELSVNTFFFFGRPTFNTRKKQERTSPPLAYTFRCVFSWFRLCPTTESLGNVH